MPPDYTPFGTQPGLEFPLRPAENCVNCHQIFDDEEEAAFFPHNTWSGSMLANATRDPLFWAALDVANHDKPGVGDYCLRCHAPKAWMEGRVAKTVDGGSIDGANGCFLAGGPAETDHANNDYQGVTCHYCHRLEPRGDEDIPLDNANTVVDDTACEGGGEPCRKGPYTYDDTELRPAHPWQRSTFVSSSEFCASCHEVSAPRVEGAAIETQILGDGSSTGKPFPIERTYTEWRRSDYFDVVFSSSLEGAAEEGALLAGQTCQQCHMPTSDSPKARAANYDTPGRRTGNLPVHEFAGGNVWMPQVLASEYGAALNRTAAYERTSQLAAEMLQTSATLEIEPGPWSGAPEALAFSVRVTNQTGHKLPTGYAEGRLMWLNVEVRDAAGELVFESGGYDEAEALVQSGSQLRTYEVIHGEWDGSECTAVEDGKRGFHFVLSNCVVADTRIPPLGFRGGDDVEISPVGRAYPPEAPGADRLVNFDVAPYAAKISPDVELPLSVTATLYYQTATRAYVEFLRDEAVENAFPSENLLCAPADSQTGRTRTAGPRDKSRGQFMYDLWEREGRSPPVQMATTTATISAG